MTYRHTLITTVYLNLVHPQQTLSMYIGALYVHIVLFF